MKRFITLTLILIFTAIPFCTVYAGEAGPLPQVPRLDTTVVPDGVRLTWTQSADADGYYIYYKKDTEEKWRRFSTKTSASSLRIRKTFKEDFCSYDFSVIAYNENGESVRSNISSEYWISPVTLTSKVKSGSELTATWEARPDADGYQIQRCKSRFFSNPYTVKLASGETAAYTFTDLDTKSNYYVRIRAFKIQPDGSTTYSPWTLSDDASSNVTTSNSILKYNGKTFEVRKAAGGVIGKHDTMQGGCMNGNFGYFAMYNRNTEKCRIAKFNMNTGKLIKKSKILPISHGNDLTFNPDKNVLVAVHCTGNSKLVSTIDPETLKIIQTKAITLDKPLTGMSESKRTAYSGIAAIAYNTKYKQYVARIRGSNDLLFLNSSFKPVRYVFLTQKDNQLYQGMDTARDYILVGQSFQGSSPYNIFSVYDWNGTYICKVTVKKGYELENIFHKGNTFYAGFYTSYYETYYTTSLRPHRDITGRFRLTEREEHKRLQRVNYIYKLSGI